MSRPNRRVAITGIGLVTPLGSGTEKNWQALVAGTSGIGPITRFDATEFPVRIAGEVRDFDPSAYLEHREIKKVDPFAQFAIAAAQMAMDDADFRVAPEVADRVGVVIGVGMGGIQTIEEAHTHFLESGVKRMSPFLIPRLIANLAPGQIAIRFGCKGVNYSPASACASGGHGVGEAARLIRLGYQDAMLSGASDVISALDRLI